MAAICLCAVGEYLPPQFIYKGKTERCHPEISFPNGWDVWHTDNHWCNEVTAKQNIEKILVPFVTKRAKIREITSCSSTF